MSVDAFRKFIAKYGVIIFGIMLIAFIASSFNRTMGCGRNPNDDKAAADQGPAIATLGKFNATALQVDQLANNQNLGPSISPETIAGAYASSTQNVIDHLYRIALASDKGIIMDDNAVQEAIPSLWAQQVDTFKQILMQGNKLKPTSTEAEFEKAFKDDYETSQGLSLEEKRQKFTDDFNIAFSDPAKRELIRSEIANQQLSLKLSALNSPSDTEVQNSFGTYKVYKLNVLGNKGVDAKAQAEKALSDIRAGMKFEDAITKYSNDGPAPGKKLTDTMELTSMTFQFAPMYKPILSLKEGEVSNVIDMGQGTFGIFKVAKFTPNVPPDFEARKGQLRKTMEQFATQAAISSDLEALKKSGKLEWKSAGFHAMYDYAEASMGRSGNMDADLKKVQADAKQAFDIDKDNGRVAALAYFISTKNVYDSSSAAQKKALTADRIASMEAVLLTTEDPGIRLQLVDLYNDAGKTSDAVVQLEKAAAMNNGASTDSLGTYEAILSKYDKLESKIPEDKKKSIMQAITSWRQVMIEEQQIRMEGLKAQAELDKKNAAEFAKQKAEADAAAKKKAEEDKKKAAAKPTTPAAPAKPKGK